MESDNIASGNQSIEICHIYFDDIVLYMESGEIPPEFKTIDWYTNNKCDYINSNAKLSILIDDKRYIGTGADLSKEIQYIIDLVYSVYKIRVSAELESVFYKQQEEMAESIEEYPDFYRKYRINNSPNCFLLSRAWLISRLSNYDNVLTIIDKKYKKMEMDIFSTLSPDYQKRCRWIFV